jgi:UDP-glucose 4-epimerase
MSTNPKRLTILVTGGTGYIDSHTCIELLQADFNVVVVDNLVNASEASLNRIKEITGKTVTFIKGDVRDPQLMNSLFQ